MCIFLCSCLSSSLHGIGLFVCFSLLFYNVYILFIQWVPNPLVSGGNLHWQRFLHTNTYNSTISITGNGVVGLYIQNSSQSLQESPIKKQRAARYIHSQSGLKTKVLGTCEFWKMSNKILNRGKASVPTILNSLSVISSLSHKFFAINFTFISKLGDDDNTLTDHLLTEYKFFNISITTREFYRIIKILD